MSWTKRQLIVAAYEEIGIANYVFDLEPEQLQSACRKMDALIASWPVNISYVSSDSPDTADIDVDSGIPAYANAAVYLNLALSLAPTMGKSATPQHIAEAKFAYLAMLKAALPSVMAYQMPKTMPRGAGQKSYERPFVNPPSDPLETGSDGELELIN